MPVLLNFGVTSLYKQILKVDLGMFEGIKRTKRFEYLPTVLSTGEAKAILGIMTGQN